MRISFRPAFVITIMFASGILQAASVGVVGLFPGKAVLIIDGAAPKTFSVGSQVTDGIKLLAVTEATATLNDHGKRQTLAIGTHSSHSIEISNPSVTLQSDTLGHFFAPVRINNLSVRMLVDTGASMITLSAQEARRLGIDYQNGRQGFSSTANGRVAVYQVRLDRVKIGDIELSQVDALVQEQGLPFALLGMSFLNRTQMQRDGERMVLTKRY